MVANLYYYSQIHLYENRGFIIPALGKASDRSGMYYEFGIANIRGSL